MEAHPCPAVELPLGSGSAAEQIAEAMVGLERIVLQRRPDFVLLYGDDEATLAAALTAVKAGARVAHVESGVRSGDRSMPAETNRILIDRLASLLFTPSQAADETL